MSWKSMWQFAFKNLWLKKTRSLLALVGLSVAIVGLICLISLSAGIQSMVTDSIAMFNGIFVMQKDVADDTMSTVSLDYLSELNDIQGVKVVVPYISGMQTTIDGGKGGLKAQPMGGMIAIMGEDASLSPKLLDGGIYKKNLKKGRYILASDTNAVVMGSEIAKEYKKAIGSTFYFSDEDKKYKVVGIMQSGSMMLDRVVVMPIEAARSLLSKDKDHVNYFYIELTEPSYESKVVSKINFKYDDIEATTASQFGEQFKSILANLDAFFILISSVAVVVGGIGILNTMLMSVMERFKEFGILKAIGWANEDILKLVLFESIILGLIGGLIGIFLGSTFVFLMSFAIAFKPVITVSLIISSIFVSITLSIVGGVYPAWKAAKLDPVEAIRYG